jgi:hypothetical protein
VVGPGARRGGCGDCGVSQRGGFGKLGLYCFRGCWWGGMGRAQSPMVPEGQKVVWLTCNVPKKTVSRRLVAPRFPPKISPQPNEGGVPRRCVPFGRKKVVCRSGERRWCDGRVEVVDATTQNQAKSKKEQPETEHENP